MSRERGSPACVSLRQADSDHRLPGPPAAGAGTLAKAPGQRPPHRKRTGWEGTHGVLVSPGPPALRSSCRRHGSGLFCQALFLPCDCPSPRHSEDHGLVLRSRWPSVSHWTPCPPQVVLLAFFRAGVDVANMEPWDLQARARKDRAHLLWAGNQCFRALRAWGQGSMGTSRDRKDSPGLHGEGRTGMGSRLPGSNSICQDPDRIQIWPWGRHVRAGALAPGTWTGAGVRSTAENQPLLWRELPKSSQCVLTSRRNLSASEGGRRGRGSSKADFPRAGPNDLSPWL